MCVFRLPPIPNFYFEMDKVLRIMSHSLSNSTKEGYFSSIFWKTISLLVYMAQATRK